MTDEISHNPAFETFFKPTSGNTRFLLEHATDERDMATNNTNGNHILKSSLTEY